MCFVITLTLFLGRLLSLTAAAAATPDPPSASALKGIMKKTKRKNSKKHRVKWTKSVLESECRNNIKQCLLLVFYNYEDNYKTMLTVVEVSFLTVSAFVIFAEFITF